MYYILYIYTMPRKIVPWRIVKPKIIGNQPRTYATIDALRDSYTWHNIDPEKFYTFTEIFKHDLLCWIVSRQMFVGVYVSDATVWKFIKAYRLNAEDRSLMKIGKKGRNNIAERVYIKWEDLLKYLYNNLTPYVMYMLENRNRMKDLFLIKTWACNI